MRALQGLLLFSFIPLVLFLFLQQPIGAGPSVLVGVAIMLGHRFLASPWMARHASERCLWCGRSVTAGEPVEVAAGGRTWTLAACSPAHKRSIGRFLTFAASARMPIGIGIFVPLAVLLCGSLARAAGVPLVAHEWNAWQFRIVVAFTVASASVAYLGVTSPAERLVCPFPLHNFFLLGIRNTLWVFRIVGAWWLVAGVVYLARALASA